MTKTKQTANSKESLGSSEDIHGFAPIEYQGPPKNESAFSFKNFYIEYSRFHMDDCNVWIHVVFIPQLAITFLGLLLLLPESFRQIQIEPKGSQFI